MGNVTDTQELRDRLSLIEHMMAEGRQNTESWGWCFVLWGVAYYIAIAWAYWGNGAIAWPVTMLTTGLLTWAVAARKGSKEPETTVGRAIGSIWMAVGASMFVLLLSAGISGHAEQHMMLAIIEAMLAVANGASGMILRWGAQQACAAIWLASAAATCFAATSQTLPILIGAIFLCQIVFGIYMMVSEARERRLIQQKSGAAHA